MSVTWVAVDIETRDKKGYDGSALDFTRAEIISFAYWSNKHQGILTNPDVIKDWFKNLPLDTKLVWHNGKFDVKILKQYLGVEAKIDWDTLLAESILPDRPEKLDLQECVAKELGFPPWKDKNLYANISTASLDSIATLNLTDVEYTYRLFLHQYEKMGGLGLLDYYLNNNLGVKTLNFLSEVEFRGVGLNYSRMEELWKQNLAEHEVLCTGLYEKYKDIVWEYEKAELLKHPLKPPKEGAKETTLKLYEERKKARELKYRFNFGSPKQITWLLKDKLNFPCRNIDGKISTGKDVLEFYKGQHPIIEDLLKLRQNEHDSSSFFQNWHDYNRDGRLHPSYRMDTARTFRLSCTEPALQQVKRDSDMRKLFIPTKGMELAVVDYALIEPRIIAHYTEDPVLLEIFNTNMDLYHVVAANIMGYKGSPSDLKTKDKEIRHIAKEIALSSFYGIGPEKLAYRVKLRTGLPLLPTEARSYLNRYFDLLSGVRSFRQGLASYLQTTPVITTPLGRILHFKPHEYSHLAFNKIMQCTGSDINLYSQVDLDNCFKQYKIDARCIHLVHDEALFEYDPKHRGQVMEAITYYMASRYSEAPFNFRVPIKIEIKTGENWGCK